MAKKVFDCQGGWSCKIPDPAGESLPALWTRPRLHAEVRCMSHLFS
jgi:hypothetical protein